jgi:hypothetical protein
MEDSKHHPATLSARKLIPHWPSANIPATISYYRDTLHFLIGPPQTLREGETQPTFVAVGMGPGAAANIYFFRDPVRALSPGRAMIAMSRAGLEEYYETLREEGRVKWVEEIEDKEWGYRQFEVEDEDGNCLQFFAFIEGD